MFHYSVNKIVFNVDLSVRHCCLPCNPFRRNNCRTILNA